jgi:hypothetical protein
MIQQDRIDAIGRAPTRQRPKALRLMIQLLLDASHLADERLDLFEQEIPTRHLSASSIPGAQQPSPPGSTLPD